MSLPSIDGVHAATGVVAAAAVVVGPPLVRAVSNLFPGLFPSTTNEIGEVVGNVGIIGPIAEAVGPGLRLPKGKLLGELSNAIGRGHLTVQFSKCDFDKVKFSFKEGEEPSLEIKFAKRASADTIAFFGKGHAAASDWTALKEKVEFPKEVQDLINKKLGFTA